jgi:hypothetical protein
MICETDFWNLGDIYDLWRNIRCILVLDPCLLMTPFSSINGDVVVSRGDEVEGAVEGAHSTLMEFSLLII